jgi:hypothetical protein
MRSVARLTLRRPVSMALYNHITPVPVVSVPTSISASSTTITPPVANVSTSSPQPTLPTPSALAAMRISYSRSTLDEARLVYHYMGERVGCCGVQSEADRRWWMVVALLMSSANINPFVQFNEWMAAAVSAQLFEPNAMNLATADRYLLTSTSS